MWSSFFDEVNKIEFEKEAAACAKSFFEKIAKPTKDDPWERPNDSFGHRHKGKLVGGATALAAGGVAGHAIYRRSKYKRLKAQRAERDQARKQATPPPPPPASEPPKASTQGTHVPGQGKTTKYHTSPRPRAQLEPKVQVGHGKNGLHKVREVVIGSTDKAKDLAARIESGTRGVEYAMPGGSSVRRYKLKLVKHHPTQKPTQTVFKFFRKMK